jgi:hypothetical protein
MTTKKGNSNDNDRCNSNSNSNSNSKNEIRTLHYAAHDETVSGFGRDDDSFWLGWEGRTGKDKETANTDSLRE